MADTREHQMGEAIRWTGGVVLLGSLLAAAPLAAAQIGTGRQMVDVNGTPLVVFTYRPAACSDPSLLMVFHSLDVDAPFGLGKAYSGTKGEVALQRYLEQPLTIYLGQGDTRDDERNDYPEALAQGASRYQRGINVFNAAKKLAQARAWRFNWRLVELPGVGHNARKMFAAPQA